MTMAQILARMRSQAGKPPETVHTVLPDGSVLGVPDLVPMQAGSFWERYKVPLLAAAIGIPAFLFLTRKQKAVA